MTRDEWLLWRHKGIGGSDAPIVLGTSPWKTALDLFEIKILPEPPKHEPNFVTDRGDRYEPLIRNLYNLMTNRNFVPALREKAAPFEFLKVSLDGLEGDDIIEIKTAGKDDHAGVKAGKVPDKYHAQVQHALHVSGAKRCFYLSYWDENWDEANVVPSNLEIIEVYPDHAFIEQMVSKEVEFWHCNVMKKKPPLPCDRDFKTLRGYAALANRWKRLKQKSEDIATQLEEARLGLIDAAVKSGHPRCEAAGVKITQVARVGNVNYKAIPELKGVDLEQYRGKGSISWRLGESASE